MENFYPFPSINQFANAIRHVKSRVQYAGKDESGEPIYNTNPLPTIKYRGTVKLHGTNAGIVFNTKTRELTFQSRERILTLEKDNAMFMLAMLNKKEALTKIFDGILAITGQKYSTSVPDNVVLFGEWCGGNIQKNVALSSLDKMLVIFGAKYTYENNEDSNWVNLGAISHLVSGEDKIFNILNFPTYELDINFENPQLIQNQIVALVNKVETECPVGLTFGSSGTGEGLVWSPVEEFNDSGYWFKTKGDKHSVSKVRTIASVDVELLNSLNEFVTMFVTENRLKQMLDVMVREKQEPFEMSSLGTFIRLVFADVMKEGQAEIIENQLDPKKLGGPISIAAKRWYINKYNTS